jgi:UPF0716 protein FxsA
MAALILLAFICVPIVEIAVFIQVGGVIGVWPTIGLTLLTAIVGTALLRAEGLATLARAQATLASGEPPVAEMLDGMCLLLAGALLLTPGFVTDAIGLILFVPPVRAMIGRALWRAFERSGRIHVWGVGGGPRPPGDRVIEGEYREVDGTPHHPDHPRIR